MADRIGPICCLYLVKNALQKQPSLFLKALSQQMVDFDEK